MAIDINELTQLIEAGIPDAKIRIEDLRGDGDHYAAYITSPAFEGKSRVQQHKMVHQALGDILGGQLHALAIQTSTPD
jgi:stress-induced morphogen